MAGKITKLKGGVHLDDNKFANSNIISSIDIIEGDEFFIPFSQNIGAPSIANVKKGEQVFVGSVIAKAAAGLSVPIHSPVEGIVKNIANVPHSSFGSTAGCVIEATSQSGEVVSISNSNSFVEHIQNAGIVGLGGAGFPTYVKLNPSSTIDTLLINASECEPYLTCDNVLMLTKYIELLEVTKIVKDELKAGSAIIAVEDNKQEAINILKQHASKYDVDIVATKSMYPQGGEKQLIYAVLNRVVEVGKLPSDVGVVVQNVGTMYAIYEAIKYNKPLYERVVTISGDVDNHINVMAKVGTPINRLIEKSNNSADGKKIVMGGVMTGSAVANVNTPITKTVGGVLLIDQKTTKQPMPCIRCGKCISVCVMGLSPTDLEKFYINNEIDNLISNDAIACVECGCCSYICPSNRLLAETIKTSKQLVMIANKKGA